MKNFFFLILLVPLTSVASFSECKLAKAALKNYLKLDTEGITTHTSKEVDSLVYYNGRDSGAHDSITIVSSHKILACTKKDPGLELQVNYKVLGELAGNATKKQLDLALLSNAKDTTESFYMVKDGKSWKIDSASIHQPHVGKSAAKNLIK